MTTHRTSDDTRLIDDESDAPAKLVVLDGAHNGDAFLLPKPGTFSLGRADTNDIVVDDGEASRHHCRIIVDDDGVRIEDLNSFNGTRVDGHKTGSQELTSGSTIRIGQTRFTLVLPDETRAGIPAVSEPSATPAPALNETSTKEMAAARPRRWGRSALIAAAALLAAAGLLFGATTALSLLSARARSVKVASSPDGAEVFLDNEFLGLTPIDVSFGGRGVHALRVARRGYETWRTAVDADTPAEMTVALTPAAVAVILVSTSDPDAAVYFDGRLVGKTAKDRPLRIPGVKLGQHELRIEKANRLPYRRRIEVTRSGLRRVHAKLVSRQETVLLDLIAKEPDSALRHTELAHLYMVNKEFDKAMASYKNALELVYSRKDTSKYHGRLGGEIDKVTTGGRGLFNYGTPAETEMAREKIEDVLISLAPKYRGARLRLHAMAKNYAKRRQVDDAIRIYRKLLAAMPEEATVYYRLAAHLMAKGELGAAVETMERAVKKFPASWAIHYRLGEVYARRAAANTSAADKASALRHLEQALRMCPTPEYQANVQFQIERTKRIVIP